MRHKLTVLAVFATVAFAGPLAAAAGADPPVPCRACAPTGAVPHVPVGGGWDHGDPGTS